MAPKIALPWLLEEDWPKWSELDARLPAHEQWLVTAERDVETARRLNLSWQKVIVRPDPFVVWCEVLKRPVDKYNRSIFAAVLSGQPGLEYYRRATTQELSPNLGDGRAQEAAA